jgi:uncharacterized circularly permuted ATP-grasp superfamily protein
MVLGRINDLYAVQLERGQEIAVLTHRNATFDHIALFLQIMGLMLVLSRDLFVRRV